MQQFFFFAINSKYFNDNFNANIYVAKNNILQQISRGNRLLFHGYYCNILQIVNKNNSSQINAIIFFILSYCKKIS